MTKLFKVPGENDSGNFFRPSERELLHQTLLSLLSEIQNDNREVKEMDGSSIFEIQILFKLESIKVFDLVRALMKITIKVMESDRGIYLPLISRVDFSGEDEEEIICHCHIDTALVAHIQQIELNKFSKPHDMVNLLKEIGSV